MKMPTSIIPMTAITGNEPFDDTHWIFEIKQDGYRMLAYIDKGIVKLKTRNLKDYSYRFPQVLSELKKLKRNAILDGEIVVENENGICDFEALISWSKNDTGRLFYYVFDLLYLDGNDFMQKPLHRRKTTLKNILPRSPIVKYQDAIKTFGKRLFDMARKEGMEGIMAKRNESLYKPGIRTKDWIKLKTYKEDDFIVCGYTRSIGSSNLFDSLILGAHQAEQLQYIGEVSSGLSNSIQRKIAAKIKIQSKCPFNQEPKLSKKWRRRLPDIIGWCKPKIVCSVKYLQLTKYELRHASLKCLRFDKTAKEVTF